MHYGWGSCGRLGRAAGGPWVGGGDGLNVRNKKWRICKIGIITCESNLVASVPGKCIEIAQEFWLLQVLSHKWMQCGQCGIVSFLNKASGVHLKTVHCAIVTCYVCHKWWIFSALLIVSLVNICGQWDCQFKDVKLFLCWIDDNNIWFEICQTKFCWDGPSSCGFPAWLLHF